MWVSAFVDSKCVAASAMCVLVFCSQPRDKASELQSLRDLREIACTKHPSINPSLELCKKYVQNRFGGLKREQAAMFVRKFMQSSQPTNVNEIYKFQLLTPSMR